MAELSIQHLLRDHRECARILAELESLLDTQKADPEWTAGRSTAFARISRFFNEVVIGHIRKEEEVLFPALEAFLPRDVGPLAVLRAEHADTCENFRRLCVSGESSAQRDNPPQLLEDFQRAGRKVLEVVRDHIYKEDRVLFPMVARFLSPELDAEILRRMEAISRYEASSVGPERVG